jgi:hypothetical protein
MRTTKELLAVMLESINKTKTGLCGLCLKLYQVDIINHLEYEELLRYIKEHRPFNLHYMIGNPYYWGKGKLKPRKRWLKRHIRRNEFNIN